MPVEGRDLSERPRPEATQDMGIDDESSRPRFVFRSGRRRYTLLELSVRLFREPDAGNLPVRFEERVVSGRREIVVLYER
jgi:hypothetical protein